jgi:hypothetical protein
MTNLEIGRALVALGYESGWTINGDTLEGIEWIDEPATKPTAKQITDKIAELPAIEAAKAAEEASKKQAILDRLGITADEAKLILS